MKKITNIILCTLPIIIFATLVLLINYGNIAAFEKNVYDWSIGQMSPFLTDVMKIITHIGDRYVIIPVCLILLLANKTRLKIGIPIGLSVSISGLAVYGLKHVFTRERPDVLRLVSETSYSFPSAHSTINAALYTMVILLILQYCKNKKIKIISIIGSVLLAVLIGYSRIYLGVHYITDVLAGWMLGFLVAYLIYIIWKKYVIDKGKIKI